MNELKQIAESLHNIELIFSDPNFEREPEISITKAIEVATEEMELNSGELENINKSILYIGDQIVDKLGDMNSLLTNICRALNGK